MRFFEEPKKKLQTKKWINLMNKKYMSWAHYLPLL